MKVLFVIDALTCGGKERRLTELMKGLKSEIDIDFELVVMNKDIHYKEVLELNIKIHYILRKSKKDVSVFKKLYSLCREYKPDIVHCWDSMTAIYSAAVCRMLGIKLINSMVVDTPVKQNIFNKIWLRGKITFPFSHTIAGNSKVGLEAYGTPDRKSVCIYNGFNFNRTNNLTEISIIKKQLNISAKYVIGMVAAFEERKDYSTLIEAAITIIKLRPDCVFLLIGEGDTRNTLMEMIPADIRKSILFPGKIDNVESYINVFDVAVLCTNTKVHQEGISNAILEYMALSKPVIATTGGGTNEIVKDTITGFLVNPHNAKELAGKITMLINNEELRKSMGLAGKQRIKDCFSIETMIRKYISVYKNALSGKRKQIAD